MSKPVDHRPSSLATVASAPLRILSYIVPNIFSGIRPYISKLVPLLVCALFVPLIILVSASAGWIVWSNLSTSWEAPLYLQYGDGVPPFALASLPPLNPQQLYDISVNLLLPNTESNVALGNFMTSLTLTTPANKTLVQVRRPAIATPPRSFAILPGKMTTRLNIQMLDSFAPGKSKLLAMVEIGRRDGWTTLGSGQGREVSVISASLRGRAIPHGIRGLAIRFPMTASLASSAIFFMILSLTLATCVLPLLLPPQSEGIGLVVKQEQPEGQPHATFERSKSREGRRKRRSRSQRSQDEAAVKLESSLDAEAYTSLPPESSAKGLRRRSSKPAVKTSDDEQ
ncbi:hypothetical protein CPC08DRAFT_815056 [Agrocybe pediades]|nr:hypothetical protein CPC08DRAFT_815056 [Agrocybe pediades]